jgi:hypothetical protein
MQSRHAPMLAMIPPPVQYAVTFLAGVGFDRLMPWRPAWMTMEGVHWAGAALAMAGVHRRAGLGGMVRAPAHNA